MVESCGERLDGPHWLAAPPISGVPLAAGVRSAMIINVFELRAILSAVWWRMRPRSFVHSRCLPGIDSVVALSADQLAPLIEIISPLLLASSFWPLLRNFRMEKIQRMLY